MTASIALRPTLANTNATESSLSVTRRVTARLTRWRDGDMRRWRVAGLLRAESEFRRLKGHRLPTLVRALESLVQERQARSCARQRENVDGDCAYISTSDGTTSRSFCADAGG